MQKFQLLLIGAAIVLLAGLFKFGQRLPPAKAGAQPSQQAAMMGGGEDMPAADFSQLLANAKKTLASPMQLRLARLENDVVRGAVKNDQILVSRELARIWDSLGNTPLAAHYLGEAAKLENSEKSLTFAANLFLSHLEHTDDASVRKWEANEAKDLLTQALKEDAENDSLKVSLGNAYIAGGDIMQGVQTLLAVTQSDPDNLEANLVLGRLAVTSGQYDKAATRLEGVIAKHPDNTEALYFLAEAYKAQGKKEKAIELFERCKKLINNPEFSKQIDDYIKTFK